MDDDSVIEYLPNLASYLALYNKSNLIQQLKKKKKLSQGQAQQNKPFPQTWETEKQASLSLRSVYFSLLAEGTHEEITCTVLTNSGRR